MLKIKNYKLKIISGFTLIELLVVMTLIAVIATVSLFALNGARRSANDARRKADLQMIAAGMELYKADCGRYPPTITLGGSLPGTPAYSPACLAANNYITRIPDDMDTARDYSYTVGVPPQTYWLCAALDTAPPAGDPNGDITNCDFTCGTPGCNWAIRSP